ncbi:hypothetical protein [Apilactobacillus xinyiensis]|uniref:hypothetical protein n=1 Tax=Apilactobacillus xinyiensis TaxID=2841032 RepID=UPI00200DD207|nr:hypothetical protein [Apilactobacillus xinyiensis]MCL0319410.1 hypothetical protein [Apilactobacillus xinyiensis]
MNENNKVINMTDENINRAISKANANLSKYSNTSGRQVKFFKNTVSNTVYLANIEWAQTKDYKNVFIGIQSDGMIFFSKHPMMDYRILNIVYTLAESIKDY